LQKRELAVQQAVITPIGGIQYKDNFHTSIVKTETGPITKKLYKELTGINNGEVKAPKG